MTLKWRHANKTETTNERKWSDLIGLSSGYKCAWLLVGSTNARMKKRHARGLSRNQSILHFDVMLQHDWPIEQCILHIRVFFGGKTKSSGFDLFIHWLIKHLTNTYQNHLSRSWQNHSNVQWNPLITTLRGPWRCPHQWGVRIKGRSIRNVMGRGGGGEFLSSRNVFRYQIPSMNFF